MDFETIDLETIKKTDDGWRYLSENSPVFEEKVNQFLRCAANYVDSTKFNIGAHVDDSGVINYENYYYGAKKVVLSFNSKPINRDLDCQFKEFRKKEFYLDEKGCLIINEKTGRLESKYGYDFTNTSGGILKTNYIYQKFSPEGIELLYRGYRDQFTLDANDFSRYEKFLRGVTRGGYDPDLEHFDGVSIAKNVIIKRPILVELSRSMSNLGLVCESNWSLNQEREAIIQRLEYHLNSFMPDKHDLDPYLIHINRGILPVAYVDHGELKASNILDKTLDIFIASIKEKINNLEQESNESLDDHQELIQNLISKYSTIYQIYFPREVVKGTSK